jgi:uncharacterized membrane protein
VISVKLGRSLWTEQRHALVLQEKVLCYCVVDAVAVPLQLILYFAAVVAVKVLRNPVVVATCFDAARGFLPNPKCVGGS